MAARGPAAPAPPRGALGERWRAFAERRFAALLALLCALGALAQAAILAEAWSENPFARAPAGDAAVYWEWAAAIASGEIVGEAPFLSGPLYAYLLALVRAAGGGLFAVCALQGALHVGTAAIVAVTARLRFGAGVGLAAALLFLLLADPAYFTARATGSTLQVALAAVLWLALVRFDERPLPRRALRAGLWTGASALAIPSMLAAVPVVAGWAWLRAGRRAAGARSLAAALGGAVLVVLPALLHNLAAAGEWIPISAQGGVTFAQGNAPGADGTYQPLPGVSRGKRFQDESARAEAARALGRELSWREAERYWYGRGLEWWRERPGEALAALAAKAWLFVSGRHYGESYLPALEVEAGIAGRLRLAPLPVAWLVLPALAMLALLLRRPLRHLPEALLLLAPLLVACAFYYSQRYRLPAAPLVAALAAAALAEVLSPGARPLRRVLLGACFAAAVLSGPANRALSIDRPEDLRGQHELSLAEALIELGRTEQAEAHLQRALELGRPAARTMLAELLRRRGDLRRALELAHAAAELAPDDPDALRTLGIALAQAGAPSEAERPLRRSLELYPQSWEARSALGNALLAQDRAEDALEQYDLALSLAPRQPEIHFNRGAVLWTLGRTLEAERAWSRALELEPAFAPARAQQAERAIEAGDWRRAARELRLAAKSAPSDAAIALRLAWLLATAPDPAVRSPAEALSLARSLATGRGAERADVLDVLASALSANGRHAEAARTAEQAAARARAAGDEGFAREIEARLERYRRGDQ